MYRPTLPMTADALARATYLAHTKVQDILARARALTADEQRDARLVKQLCKACFYGPPRVAGAAMTTQPCMCCETDQLYSSTNTDVLCGPCAKTHDLCKHCGGDIEMRVDRAEWPSK